MLLEAEFMYPRSLEREDLMMVKQRFKNVRFGKRFFITDTR